MKYDIRILSVIDKESRLSIPVDTKSFKQAHHIAAKLRFFLKDPYVSVALIMTFDKPSKKGKQK